MTDKTKLFTICDTYSQITNELKTAIESAVNNSHKNKMVLSIDEFENQFLVRIKSSNKSSKENHEILMDEQSDNKVDLLNCITMFRHDGKKIKFGVWKRKSASKILR